MLIENNIFTKVLGFFIHKISANIVIQSKVIKCIELPINVQLEKNWGKLKESTGGLVISKPIFKKYYSIITLVNRIFYK